MNKRFEMLEKHSARIVELGELIDQGERNITKGGLCEYFVELSFITKDNKVKLRNKVFAFSEEHAYRRAKGKAITDFIEWEEKNESQG